MSKYILETCYSLKEAIKSIKNKLNETDTDSNNLWNWYKENNPKKIEGKTMEGYHWNDKVYLVYRNDFYIDECWIFNDSYNIELWLEEKWSDWGLWEYRDIEGSLNKNLVIWEFHRDICKEKWKNLYRKSKQFIDGWSRKQIYVEFKTVPSFSVG